MKNTAIAPGDFGNSDYTKPMNRLVKSCLLPLATSALALALASSACAKASHGEDLKETPEQANADKATDPVPEKKAAANLLPTKTMPTEITAEKPASDDTVVAAVETQPKPIAKEQTLEEAIKAPGSKKITAMSADGRTKVIEMGQVTLADTETFILKARVPDSVAVGKDSMVSITLTPKTGWKINQEFPTKLKIVAPAGTSLKSASLSAKDAKTFSKKSAEFQVAFSATAAGVKKFSGNMRFAMCTDTTCDPKKADLAWTLVAK